MPQVPVSGGGEDRLTLEVLLAINVLLRENTFDAGTEARLLEALSGDETRSDRVHRNDVDQQIEAEFIADWLQQRGVVAGRGRACQNAARPCGVAGTR